MRQPAYQDIANAHERIRHMIARTPFVPSPFLSRLLNCEILLKLECFQPIGAFKLRGAANAMLSLPADARGVTCCSTGNHGRAIAFAARQLGFRAVICMTQNVPATKVDGIRALGAEVRITGQTQDEAQAEADRLVDREGFVDISPFDDPAVISGQGTVALEMLEERPDLRTIVTPLSGGGLAAGMGLVLRAEKPGTRLIGATMETGPAMHLSLKAGRPVDVVEAGSLADALGGGIFDDNQYTLNLCRAVLDQSVLVSEEAIYRAMQLLFFEERLVVEGSSATTIAALVEGQCEGLQGPVGVVITGRNVDTDMFRDILEGRDLKLGNTRIRGEPYRQPLPAMQ